MDCLAIGRRYGQLLPQVNWPLRPILKSYDTSTTFMRTQRASVAPVPWTMLLDLSTTRPWRTFGGDETRWQAGFGFVSSVVTWISKSGANNHLQPIQSRLQQLSIIYSQLHVKKRSSTEKVRSLPASTIEALYTMLDPESAHNPFPRIRTRWRIYVSFLLMLHQGMRRGEVLLLPADAVKSAYDSKLNRDRYWINIRENEYEESALDPRYSKPSIKTKDSIRQIPLNETTARIIELYSQNFRGRPSHSFL